MFGYVILFLIALFSVKLAISINEHIPVMEEFKVNNVKARFLQITSLFYIFSLLIFILATNSSYVQILLLISLLLIVPGIWAGKTVSNILDTSGTSRTIKAKNISSNIMWLGIAASTFIIANLGLLYFVSSVGKHPWE